MNLPTWKSKSKSKTMAMALVLLLLHLSFPLEVFCFSSSSHADRIVGLPGQPHNIGFQQFSGYVTVDDKKHKSLFYYFVESETDPASKPLVLWLNGGLQSLTSLASLIFKVMNASNFEIKKKTFKTLD